MNGKLVRDGIPDIIVKNGGKPDTRILNKEEYLKELDKKLQEEVDEYLEANDLAELGDVLELIHAIAAARGSSPKAIEKIREEKRRVRGGFQKRIFLKI